MTRDDIIRMAREAGAMFDHMTWVERDLEPVFERFAALVAAAEQAEKQEPHSLLCVCGAEWDIYPDGKEVLASTAPRQWQGLTDEEINRFSKWAHPDIIETIEAALKDKNS